MAAAAKVISVQGEVFARSPNGTMRRLDATSTIEQGEMVISSSGGSAELLTADGQMMSVHSQESFQFGPESALSTAPSAGEAAVAAGAKAATVIQPGEVDLDKILEDATAAGFGGAGENGGNSFVRLMRISEELTPLSYAFPNAGADEFRTLESPGGDDAPVAGAAVAGLNEDGLAGGNAGGIGDAGIGVPSSLVGVMNYSFGADGPAEVGAFRWVSVTAADYTDIYSGGQLVQYEISTDGLTLRGFIEGEDGEIPVFELVVTDSNTGAYSLTLLRPLDHVGANEDDINFTFNYQLTDLDGDTDNGTLAVTVDDDTPVLLDGEMDEYGNVVNGTIYSTGGDYQGDYGEDSGTSTVDSWSFTVNQEGPVTIDVRALENQSDLNGDGERTYLDSYIYIFKNVNGQPGELVYSNDDADDLPGNVGFGDGSTDSWDSYGQLNLPAGEYILRIGSFYLDEDEARAGLNDSNSGQGDYQVTFGGDVTVTSGPSGGTSSGPGDTIRLEEESAPGLLGNNETDDGLSYTASGTIVDDVAWGADGFGAATAFMVGETEFAIPQDGSTTAYFDADGAVQGDGEGAAAMLLVNSDGTYTFTVLTAMNHALVQGENILYLPAITVTGVDGDGDPVGVPLNISIQDDKPELVSYVEGEGDSTYSQLLSERATVDEDDIRTDLSLGTSPNDGAGWPRFDGSYTGPAGIGGPGPANVSGSVAALVSFGADGPGDNGFSLSDEFDGLYDQELTSAGEDLDYRVVGNTLEGYVEGDGEEVSERVVFTLQLDSDGTYTFSLYDQLDHEVPDGEDLADQNTWPIDLSSVIIATDADGDFVTLDHNFTINITDDVPAAGRNWTVQLEDDDLEGGLDPLYPRDTGDDFAPRFTTGTLSHAYGADEAGGSLVLTGAGLPQMPEQDEGTDDGGDSKITTTAYVSEFADRSFAETLSDDGLTLTISQLQGEEGWVDVLKVTLTNDVDGKYNVEQLNNILHPDGDAENNAPFSIGYQITDGDGDKANGTLSINVDDDMPRVTDVSELRTIAEANIDTSDSTGSVMVGYPRLGPTEVTGSLMAVAGQGGHDALVSFGADGAAQAAFGFTSDAITQLANMHLASWNNQNVPLVANDFTISAPDVNGWITLTAREHDIDQRPGQNHDTSNQVFELKLNQNTGEYKFILNDELVHRDADGNPTDVINLDFGKMITATDRDGDTITLGDIFTITVQDDAPVAVAQASNDEAILDETNDRTGYVEGSTFFNRPNFGADHEGSETYALNATAGARTGLWLAGQSGEVNEIRLVINGTAIEGRVGGTIGGALAFKVTIDANDGDVSVQQFRALEHGVDGTSSSAHDDPVFVGPNAPIKIVQTLTDSDGDSDSATSAPLVIRFEDDGPSVDSDKNSQVVLEDDDLQYGNDNGDGSPWDNPAPRNATGTLDHDYGYDDAGSLKLTTVNLPETGNFSQSLSSNGLILTISQQQGESSVEVVRITLSNTTDGNYTVGQLANILHPTLNGSDGDDKENNVEFNVNYRVTDRDGDWKDGSFDVTVDDDMPAPDFCLKSGVLVIHDETPGVDLGSNDVATDLSTDLSSLFAAVSNKGFDPDMSTSYSQSAGAVVAVTPNYGADGAGGTVFSIDVPGSDEPSGLFTTEGKAITLFEVNSTLVVGRYDGTDSGSSVGSNDPAAFAIHIDPTTGKMTVAQYVSIKHDDRGDLDESNDNGTNDKDDQSVNDIPNPVQQAIANDALRVTVAVTDRDGDTVSERYEIGNKVMFEDDGPTVTPLPAAQPEYSFTATYQNVGYAGYDNSYGYYVKGADGNIDTSKAGGIIWANVHNAGTTPVTVGGYAPEQVGFFIIPDGGDGRNSGLANGDAVTFTMVNGFLQAYEGSTPLTGTGANIFFDKAALNVDGYSHVDNNVTIGNQNWEDLLGSTDSDYEDVNVQVNWAGGLRVDESSLNTSASLAFAGQFNVNYGADGKQSLAYALAVTNGTDSGLIDSATGQPVLLRTNAAGDVEGYVTPAVRTLMVALVDPNVVFTVHVNTTTGEVSLTQARAVMHPTADPDGFVTLADANKITLTATATDNDGDKAVGTLGIGTKLHFGDDAPLAINDNDSVAEGIATTDVSLATGNVLTGFGTTNNGADTPGADAGLSVTSLRTGAIGQWSTPTAMDADGVSLTGVYGTLTLLANGEYSYALNNAAANVQALYANQEVTDAFTYTMKDKDGDSGTATLTIKVVGTNDAPTIDAQSCTPTIYEDSAITIAASELLARAHDVDVGDMLSLTAVTVNAAQGAVIDNGDATYTFIPKPDFFGPASLSFTVSDGHGGQATGAYAINVQGLLEGPYNILGVRTGTGDNDQFSGGSGDDVMVGRGGDDTLVGGEGNDSLYGGASLIDVTGNDNLLGVGGNDKLVGGLGNDTLAGGDGNDTLWGDTPGLEILPMGADTFVWKLGDGGTTGSPAADIVKDFSRAEGDVLDLSDLLQGEHGTVASLVNEGYLKFELSVTPSGTNTVLTIDTNGGATPSTQNVTQTVTFENANLFDQFGATDSADLVSKMLTANQLKTDV